MKKFAVVTGASSGLGRSIALELSRRKINTLLVSLPREGLREVCLECRRNGCESECFELDLTNRDALSVFVEHINENYEVFALFNNAGIGGSRRFDDVPMQYIDDIINLNISAATMLVHELLPNLKRNAESYILNISSMAALVPCGYKTVYPASKAYIKHFSLGLREELKEYGVSVSLAVLGPMPTREDIIRRIESQGVLGQALSVKAERAAEVCVKKTLAKKRIIIAGKLNILSFYLLRFIPEYLRTVLMSRSVKRNEL